MSSLQEQLLTLYRQNMSSLQEQLRELKREIKKKRCVKEPWYSFPGTATEIDRGEQVELYGRKLVFPFKLTTCHFDPEEEEAPFKNNPDMVPVSELSERVLKDRFIYECRNIEGTQLTVKGIDYTLFDTRIVFIQKESPLDPLNVVAVGEIMKQTDNEFKKEDIGQAISFGEKVLQIQQWRNHIYVILTDYINIIFYKVTRKGNQFSYEFTATESLTYAHDPPNGWKYLMTIMESSPEQLGWVDPTLKFGEETVTLVRSINTGSTSTVYEGRLNNEEPVVVKMVKDDTYLPCIVREKDALERLSALESPHFPRLLLSNENTLVMTPLGTKVDSMQKKDIRDIINALKKMHSQLHIIHRDLGKRNFLRNDNGNILIIDWGYSVNDAEDTFFAGAIPCMPDDILFSLANNRPIYYYGPNIDLICFVRTLYLMFFNPEIEIDKGFSLKQKALYFLNFWSYHGVGNLWKKIHQNAENLNYDQLIQEIELFY